MPAPSLGYGKPTEATIDQVNQWMRGSPWYQQLLKSFGQDPTNVHLNDYQKQQVMRAAQAQGVVIDEGDMEVDPAGNFNPKGHKLRNTLIVAGIAGATIATMGAAGAFSGAAGAGAGGGGITGGAATGIAGGASMGAPAVAGAGGLGSVATVAGAAGGGGGLWNTIGKVAKGVAGFGPEIASVAAGRAQGRIDESGIQQRQDQLAQQRYGNVLAGANVDLSQRQFALQAPQARASNAVRGDVLANAQDFSYGAPTMVGNIPVPTSSGGLRPSILSPATRQLGGLMSSQALSGQQAGDTFAPLEPVPGLTPLPEAGTFDKILNTAGTVGAFAPAFTDYLDRYRPKRPNDELPPFDPQNPWGG